jgi:rubrerythrin
MARSFWQIRSTVIGERYEPDMFGGTGRWVKDEPLPPRSHNPSPRKGFSESYQEKRVDGLWYWVKSCRNCGNTVAVGKEVCPTCNNIW